jgi:hypothetical protein
MMTEKMGALAEVQVAVTAAALRGSQKPRLAHIRAGASKRQTAMEIMQARLFGCARALALS